MRNPGFVLKTKEPTNRNPSYAVAICDAPRIYQTTGASENQLHVFSDLNKHNTHLTSHLAERTRAVPGPRISHPIIRELPNKQKDMSRNTLNSVSVCV